MSHTHRPDRDIAHTARIFENHVAYRFRLWEALITQLAATTTERTGNSERVHTSGISDPTANAAANALHANNEQTDADTHRTDWLNTCRMFAQRIEEGITDAHKRLGTSPEPLTIVHLCGDQDRAKSYDGRQLAWVPMSRNADNGWHDATCRDIAGPTGLCPRCLVRLNRWRERHGLALIDVQPTRVAA